MKFLLWIYGLAVVATSGIAGTGSTRGAGGAGIACSRAGANCGIAVRAEYRTLITRANGIATARTEAGITGIATTRNTGIASAWTEAGATGIATAGNEAYITGTSGSAGYTGTESGAVGRAGTENIGSRTGIWQWSGIDASSYHYIRSAGYYRSTTCGYANQKSGCRYQ